MVHVFLLKVEIQPLYCTLTRFQGFQRSSAAPRLAADFCRFDPARQSNSRQDYNHST